MKSGRADLGGVERYLNNLSTTGERGVSQCRVTECKKEFNNIAATVGVGEAGKTESTVL